MRSHTRLMRLGMWLATTSLSLTASLPALAQPAPPPGSEQGAQQPGADPAGDANTDPPALAGRVATIEGTVSFHNAGETQWSPATLNYPVTNGEAFWTEPAAQATLEVADDRIVLASSTELDVTALDQAQFTTTAAQGAMFLQLRSLPQGQNVTVNTPRGAVQITAAGRYEIVAGDTDDATMVTVVEGAAHVAGTNLALDVGPQQTATIGGTDTLQGSVGPMQTDAFLQGLLRTPARRSFAAGVPAQVQYMTGAADLQTYGSFSQTQQYGQVWYPQSVPANWAPYRDGHWAYVHPWGWTWVDNARWGFAPFHYGRWVQVENRWGWVPGEAQAEVSAGSPYPVYSPALVTFLDVGGAALAGASINFAVGGYAPAWIPLGPREPYYPWYRCQPSYFARLNTPYGVPETIIRRGPTYINNTTINNRNVFINERAATVVPAGAFAAGRPIEAVYRPLPQAALVSARPFVGRLAVVPTAQTPNLPREAAQRFNIAPRAAALHAVAGPRIAPEADFRRGAPPPLRRAALPPSVRAVPAAEVGHGERGAPGAVIAPRGELRPGQVAPPRGQESRPVAPVAGPRPQAGLPALRSPGGGRPDARLGSRPDQPPGRPAFGAPGETARVPQGEPARAPQGVRPGLAPRPGTPVQTPEERRAGVPAEPRGQLARPAEPARPEAGGQARVSRPNAVEPRAVVPPARVEPRGAEPAPRRAETPRLAPAHPEAPRPEARPAARPETARPEATRPAPRAEAPRAEAPRAEAPRPPARPEPPRAPARPEAPRPAPALRPAPAPRPEQHAEAPRPAPAPRPEPHPAPAHQAPARDRKEPPKP